MHIIKLNISFLYSHISLYFAAFYKASYMETVLLILFYLFFPAVIIYFSEKFTIIEKIGTVVIAYVFGLILGNSGIISEDSKVIQDTVAFITIP